MSEPQRGVLPIPDVTPAGLTTYDAKDPDTSYPPIRPARPPERSFEEERRRTKVIPRLIGEKAALKLVFATMIRAADRWCRVSINDIERHQLKLLRAELGLDPPPAETNKRNTDRRKSVAA